MTMNPARRGPRYLRGMNSTSIEVATGYSIPTATPITSRSRNSVCASCTQYCASDARTNRIGPTKYMRRRPNRWVSQPPRKPPKKIPINAEAAIMPSQKLSKPSAADVGIKAMPIRLST
ncbi:hypothetical protein D3C71_1366500 [compost metagenome]